MYPALKLYFDTQDKCPTLLKSFLSDPVAIIWFHFIQRQLKIVCDTIKRIEGDNISACEVSEELEALCGKIKNRKTQNFLTSGVNSMILELETKNKYTKKQFIEQTNQFYDTFLFYIEKWGNSFEELKIFRWTQLINCPTWNDIQKSLTFILQNNKQTGWNVDEDILFDEKSRFLVPTIKSIIILKNHFKKYSCNDFYDFLLTQPKLLNAISSSQKYSNDTFDNKGHDEQSTSTQ
ncbi:Hypothetical protein CINCED_3A020788 [Cinara cedri]|uniref:Uncharacterized protein n=1 Tax=Cinara cedri TaxID=506608 RepID=A0A5E4MU87_9HEMI|nr:Hypothetical protein CINCED_3A020788 [Cinara cedri]